MHISQQAKALITLGKTASAGKYLGYTIGTLIAVNNDLILGAKTLNALTLAYRQHNQPTVKLNKGQLITISNSNYLSTIGFYCALLLASSIAQSAYLHQPQNLVMFLSAVSVSLTACKIYSYFASSPSMNASHEKQEHQNSLFVISILGHILGGKTVGFMF